MKPRVAGVVAAVAALVVSACSSAAAADLRVGDCLKISGPPDRPETDKVLCGSPQSNYKVVATVAKTDQCFGDVDTYYSTRRSFDGSGSTVCLDVDWVVGGCMSIDPDNDRDPVRVDCTDRSAPDRQRVVQVMKDVANVDQCGTGLGYAYDEREFTVCVENVS